jgi:hypothetical protein
MIDAVTGRVESGPKITWTVMRLIEILGNRIPCLDPRLARMYAHDPAKSEGYAFELQRVEVEC